MFLDLVGINCVAIGDFCHLFLIISEDVDNQAYAILFDAFFLSRNIIQEAALPRPIVLSDEPTGFRIIYCKNT